MAWLESELGGLRLRLAVIEKFVSNSIKHFHHDLSLFVREFTHFYQDFARTPVFLYGLAGIQAYNSGGPSQSFTTQVVFTSQWKQGLPDIGATAFLTFVGGRAFREAVGNLSGYLRRRSLILSQYVSIGRIESNSHGFPS